MKPFSFSTQCVKCGSSDIRNVWMEFGEAYFKTGEVTRKSEESMNRICACGYEWIEAPLDGWKVKDHLIRLPERFIERGESYPSDEYKTNPQHPHYECCGKGNYCDPKNAPGCKYCRSETKDEWADYEYEIVKNSLWVKVSGGDGRYAIEISFCPFCGASLDGGEKE